METPERRVAAARALRRQTQAGLASEIARISGDPTWDRARIAAIENERRRINAYELTWFMEAQDQPVTWYLGELYPVGSQGGYLPELIQAA